MPRVLVGAGGEFWLNEQPDSPPQAGETSAETAREMNDSLYVLCVSYPLCQPPLPTNVPLHF
jgi:hypothetical protein